LNGHSGDAAHALLQISDLHAQVDGKAILKGLSLTVHAGSVHAIMGPNGSGKSTLANVLAGKPGYEVTDGSVLFDGQDLLAMEPEARAHAGLFLAFQYPVEIPGVSNMEFLKTAMEASAKAKDEAPLSTAEFMKTLRSTAAELDLGADFLKRGVNEGFSGGEKKRNEILQMKLLRPRFALLDETDSGLDIDALAVVGNGVNAFVAEDASRAVLMITHYQRLLNHIVPDVVHVLADGRIVETGDKQLALTLEERGYAWLKRA
jgi:Fe-S cluster assembly ATP-binding protein